MLLENPFAQPGFVLVEGEIPVLGLSHHRGIAAQSRLGIDKVCSIQRGAAGFALVAIGMLVAAVGAGARDVAVGKELMCLLVVILHRRLLDKLACVIQLLEVFRRRFVVLLARGAAIDVERDAELSKRVLDNLVVSVHNILRGDTLLASLDGDGYTMLVAASDEHHILALSTQVTNINVGRNINTRQMSDVDRPVGIRQRRGYGITLEMLVFFAICHSLLFLVSV